MAYCRASTALLTFLLGISLLAPSVAAFGAGNIASISKLEGHNWRHGDIEDVLKTVAFLKGHKWTSMMVKRAYFGNWLRDYSQAVDVGTLKGVQAGTIRILVWVLSFLTFGYATAEFEVTDERLGVYRPEEHIDNPRGYADDIDARTLDPRLRGPVMPEELAVDPQSGMKNYIANESGSWATSSGYIKYSFMRSIHFGRVYTSGPQGIKGREADLCEALRCLGQGLHCLEDFGAHTNYTELALREMGHAQVFPHVGGSTELNLRGRRVFPLVTGSFGVVDFLHSVLGEATDHFAQSEVNELDKTLGEAEARAQGSSGADRGFSVSGQHLQPLTHLLAQIPGSGGELCQQAERLQADADAQAAYNQSMADQSRALGDEQWPGPPTEPFKASGSVPGPGIPGMDPNFDPVQRIAQIYPILEFRDRVVKAISATIEKVPGLTALCEKISEMVTTFVLSLLAPFIRPIISAVSKQLQQGSGLVVDASAKHQYEPWTDPHCTDPTHSLLSKDHFTNILNEPAGQVAASILQYVAPRVIFAWGNPGVPVDQVLNDVARVFHHPATRDQQCEVHRNMFDTVQRWAHSLPDGGSSLNYVLGSESVRAGKNHKEETTSTHSQGHSGGMPNMFQNIGLPNLGGYGAGGHNHSMGGYGMPHGLRDPLNTAKSLWQSILRDSPGMRREIDDDDASGQTQNQSSELDQSQTWANSGSSASSGQNYGYGGSWAGSIDQQGSYSQQPPQQTPYSGYSQNYPSYDSYGAVQSGGQFQSYPGQEGANYGGPQYPQDPNLPAAGYGSGGQYPFGGAPPGNQGQGTGGQYYGGGSGY